MPNIYNDSQLYATFSPILNNAIEYVMRQIVEEYKSLIEEIVYDRNGIGNAYDRTYDFLNSWETQTTKNLKGATGILGQEYENMTIDRENFIHGSNYPSANDVRPALANIIYEGLSGDLFGAGWWQESRDAWTPLIKELDDGNLDRWFKDGMAQQGVMIEKEELNESD